MVVLVFVLDDLMFHDLEVIFDVDWLVVSASEIVLR